MRKIKFLTFMFVLLLLSSGLSVFQFGFVPSVKAQESNIFYEETFVLDNVTYAVRSVLEFVQNETDYDDEEFQMLFLRLTFSTALY